MFSVLHGDVCGAGVSHHGHSHGNGNGHSHEKEHYTSTDTIVPAEPSNDDTVSQQERASQRSPSHNINVHAAIIHLIGDFVQSVGVLIAAILIKINVCS